MVTALAELVIFDMCEEVRRERYFHPAAFIIYHNLNRRTRNCRLIWALEQVAQRVYVDNEYVQTAFDIYIGDKHLGDGMIYANLEQQQQQQQQREGPQISSPPTLNNPILLDSPARFSSTFIMPSRAFNRAPVYLTIISVLVGRAEMNVLSPVQPFAVVGADETLTLHVTGRWVDVRPQRNNGWLIAGLQYMANVFFESRRYGEMSVIVSAYEEDVGYLDLVRRQL